MTNFTAPNYLQDAAHPVAEQKLAFEQNLAATKELLGGLPVTGITMTGTSRTTKPPNDSSSLTPKSTGNSLLWRPRPDARDSGTMRS